MGTSLARYWTARVTPSETALVLSVGSLSNNKAFAQCQVDKVFKSICLRDPNVFAADRNARDGFVSNFVGSTPVPYNMREVFTDVAAYCKGS